MNARKWITLALSGGLLFEIGACTSDLTYYAIEAFVEDLPDLLDTWLATVTETA